MALSTKPVERRLPAATPVNQARRVGGEASRDLTVARRLSSALTVVALISAAVGVFLPGIFHTTAMSAGNAQGTDLVILAIALPTLVASMALAAHGSLRAQLVWAGALTYIVYNSVPFAFSIPFNQLFLVYIATLSLSVWSLVAILMAIDPRRLAASFVPKTPVRALAAYMGVVVVAFAGTWLKDAVPALLGNTTPASLEGTGMLTNWIQVLDLGFTLPISALAALWLWQRKSWGYVLSGMMLVMMVIETASIATDQLFGHLADPNAPLTMAPVFAALTAIGLIPAAALLRSMRREPEKS